VVQPDEHIFASAPMVWADTERELSHVKSWNVMLPLIWLFLMAFCGWTAGEIVGGKGVGQVIDVLLGVTGALSVRLSLEGLRVDPNPVSLLLFSVWGAAALPAVVKYLVRSRHEPKAESQSPAQAPLEFSEELVIPHGSDSDVVDK
jgi:uncharacterized membrane protein YeaQ/YmgE (transglycosylase-associated protein family)